MFNKLKIFIKKRFDLYQLFIKCYVSVLNLKNSFLGFFAFIKDYSKFKKLAKINNIHISGFIPIFKDRYSTAGDLDSHYFLQDLYMAKKIIFNGTGHHYDIGSRIDGFISHLLSSDKIDVTMLDIRALPFKIDNLNFIQTDATNLKEIKDNSIESLSSLHALEHFGLGRYGDPIDPSSCFKAMKSMQRVLADNGIIYLSTPISNKDEIWFNSLRKFSPKTIIDQFNELELLEFSVIHNFNLYTYTGDNLIAKIKNNEIPIDSTDCGMFVFRKPLKKD